MIDTWRCLYNVMARIDRVIGSNTMEIAMARSNRAMTAGRGSVLKRAGMTARDYVSALNVSPIRPFNNAMAGLYNTS